MAKGENLEKPKKKGGMVIVIGMGAKPKDNMKKSFGRGSEDDRLANRAKTHRRFQSGRRNIEDILERRKIDPDEFHGEFRRRFDMDFEDYLKQEGGAKLDVQGLIDELAEKRFSQRKETAQRGQERREKRINSIRSGLMNTEKFKGMLRNKGISESDWKNAVKAIPDHRINDNTFNQLVDKLSVDRSQIHTYSGNTRPYSEIFPEYEEAHAGVYDPRDGDFDDDDDDGDEEPMTEDEHFRRIARLLEARYPPEVAEDMARRYLTRSFHFSPSEHEFNRNDRPDDEDPNIGFAPSMIGAETPKSQTANPRDLGPLLSPRAGQGEGMVIRPFQMQTSFDDPKNVMDSAWALLKGNPSMRDAEGRAINHPAAMVYDDLADQIHMNEQNPFDALDEDDESVSHVMERMKRLPSERVREIGQALHNARNRIKSPKQEAMRATHEDRKRLNRYRQFARDRTSQMMDEPDQAAGPNFGMQQSTGTDVKMKEGNIMDQM